MKYRKREGEEEQRMEETGRNFLAGKCFRGMSQDTTSGGKRTNIAGKGTKVERKGPQNG